MIDHHSKCSLRCLALFINLCAGGSYRDRCRRGAVNVAVVGGLLGMGLRETAAELRHVVVCCGDGCWSGWSRDWSMRRFWCYSTVEAVENRKSQSFRPQRKYPLSRLMSFGVIVYGSVRASKYSSSMRSSHPRTETSLHHSTYRSTGWARDRRFAEPPAERKSSKNLNSKNCDGRL